MTGHGANIAVDILDPLIKDGKIISELLSNVVYGPLLSGDLVFPDSINETNVFDNLSKSAISSQPAPA